MRSVCRVRNSKPLSDVGAGRTHQPGRPGSNYNKTATPLTWVATADSILAKIDCLCRRISETGYRGAIVEKNGSRYKLVGNRLTSVHGLLGMIRYRRAYYISEKKGKGSWIPLDEQLGIAKERTPGLQYILSGFTAREVYQGSLDWFHQIFRPDGKDLISMRKALDMDYELGGKLKEKRRQQIAAGEKKRAVIEEQHMIMGTAAVSG